MVASSAGGSRRTAPRLAAAYLLLQGALGIAWWAGVLAWPAFRARFEPAGAAPVSLTSFWLADFVFVVAGSFAAAFGVARGRPWARPVLLVVAGAVAYATLYCVVLSVATRAAGAMVILMVPAAVLTAGCAKAAR